MSSAFLAMWLGEFSTQAVGLGKYEPPAGCYIGAFVDRDFIVRGDFAKFQELTKKKHASYLTYVAYGRPFPRAWVEKVKAVGAAPHIALEPNEGLERVRDDAYLRRWAREAAAANCPIFLRFASEMNGAWTAYYGNPALYIQKFQLVSQVMQQEAPNVAMVWTPFAVPQENIPAYYPGDVYVDWVGVNIYSVYVHDGDAARRADHKDPVEFLRYVYNLYAHRKPIQISEFAATHYCKATKQATVDFAIEKMTRLYQSLKTQFPRVKMINWFCLDTIAVGLADNNYSLTDNERVLQTYRTLIADPYFLSDVPYHFARRPPPPKVEGAGTPASVSSEERLLDEALEHRGAVMTALSSVRISHLKNHQVVSGSLEIGVLFPLSLRPRYVMFVIDGRLSIVTNVAPFRCLLSKERLKAGTHTVKAIAYDADGKVHESETVTFTVM
ncbi:MAG: glycoside hydrolase family 26 protein [Abditibacteriales bacterium]|nr:glycoside hydrolase family 26 protein [Abditibacteriales bacterium]MDW8366353.1 glycosyl hydrolase [Abditibacteriales bacterium]